MRWYKLQKRQYCNRRFLMIYKFKIIQTYFRTALQKHLLQQCRLRRSDDRRKPLFRVQPRLTAEQRSQRTSDFLHRVPFHTININDIYN